MIDVGSKRKAIANSSRASKRSRIDRVAGIEQAIQVEALQMQATAAELSLQEQDRTAVDLFVKENENAKNTSKAYEGPTKRFREWCMQRGQNDNVNAGTCHLASPVVASNPVS